MMDEEDNEEADVNDDESSDQENAEPTRKRQAETQESIDSTSDLKRCGHCRNRKQKTEFHRDKSKNDGRKAVCKTCVTELGQEAHARRKKLPINRAGSKCCIKCGLKKLKTDFNDTFVGDGVSNTCKLCQSEANKRNYKMKKELPVNREGSKCCSQCEVEKPKTEFLTKFNSTDSLYNVCNECRKQNYQENRDYILQRRQELGPCDECRESNVFLLGFTHLDDKRFFIGNSTSKASIEAELVNCKVKCVMCQRKAQSEDWAAGSVDSTHTKTKLHKEKEKYVHKIKSEIGGCIHCGFKISESFGFSCFDFDHLQRSEKYLPISEIVWKGTCSLEDLKTEILKCQLLCAACHLLKSAIECHYYGDRYKSELEAHLQSRAHGKLLKSSKIEK
jgi:hypothetical protein